jgi:hypothetical protein
MGASSGPGVVAIFSGKPYCQFNTDLQLDLYKGSIRQGNRGRLFFGNATQSLLFGRETPDLIAEEFERMWNAIENPTSRDRPSPQSSLGFLGTSPTRNE